MTEFPFSVIAVEDVARATPSFSRPRGGGTGSNFEFRVRRKDARSSGGSRVAADLRRAPTSFSAIVQHLGCQRAQAVRARPAGEGHGAGTGDKVQTRLVQNTREEQARLNHLLSAMNIGILFEDSQNR